MGRNPLYFLLFTWATSLQYAMTAAIIENAQRRTVACPAMTVASRTECLNKAASSVPNPSMTDELAFFQTCIADYFCFVKADGKDEWVNLPTFKGFIGTPYFNQAAKRAELFFIRNNDWSTLTRNPTLRESSGKCTNLLYVIAARQLYATYVLDYVKGEQAFGPCPIDEASRNIKVEANSVCYPVHAGPVTCMTDYDIALIGERSGTHASLFSMFFKETVSVDASVPGFGKSSEDLLNTNIYAFSLEYAMPSLYAGLSAQFRAEVAQLNGAHTFQIQEVVSALKKMEEYHNGYHNDLHTDHQLLRTVETTNDLFAKFSYWDTEMKRLYRDIRVTFTSQTYMSEVNFENQNNIAYVIILGLMQTKGLTGYIAKAVSETGIALLYKTDTYHTRGALRHVVGWTQMKRTDIQITTTDYWVSMLENWADCVKEFGRECEAHKLVTARCLPKMSKFMWRMLDAMFAAHSRLPDDLRTHLLIVDNAENSGLRSIVSHWYVDVKKAGLDEIPTGDSIVNMQAGMTTVDYFLQAFACPGQQWQKKFSRSCMNKINDAVREYNRALFTDMARKDKKP